MWQAWKYGGMVVLKEGKKNTPGPIYMRQDVENRTEPILKLWEDGTITQSDRPEGTVDDLKKAPFPAWAR